MRRLTRKAILVIGAYIALLLAVLIAGFIAQTIGIWASVIWGAAIITAFILYSRRRRHMQNVP